MIGESPALVDAVNREDLYYQQYLRGIITREQFINLVGKTWSRYNLDYPQHAVDAEETVDLAKKLADSEYAQERRNNSEQAQKKLEAQKLSIENELAQKGIQLPSLEGLSFEEQLRILREIKKMCDEIEGKYGKWDDTTRDEAQREVQHIIDKAGEQYCPPDENQSWWDRAKSWWGENWSLVVAGVLIAASVVLLALSAVVVIPALAVATGITVSASAVGAAGGALAVTGGVTLIGSEIAYSNGLITAKQRLELSIGGEVALFSGGAVYLVTKGINVTPLPKENNLEQLDANKWNHILQEKHYWNKIVDNPTIDSVKEIIQRVLSQGRVEKYKGVESSVLEISNETVRVTYRIIEDIRKISDAWVIKR